MEEFLFFFFPSSSAFAIFFQNTGTIYSGSVLNHQTMQWFETLTWF